MNTNTVSPATARLLAAAGFPQPAPAPGQWWGDESGVVLIFGETIPQPGKYWEDENGVMQPVVGLSPVVHYVADGRPIIDDYFDDRDFRGLVYLPTVGDILRELGCWFELLFGGNQTWLVCQTKSLSDYPEVVAEHKTIAAEAAALAYFELKKQ